MRVHMISPPRFAHRNKYSKSILCNIKWVWYPAWLIKNSFTNRIINSFAFSWRKRKTFDNTSYRSNKRYIRIYYSMNRTQQETSFSFVLNISLSWQQVWNIPLITLERRKKRKIPFSLSLMFPLRHRSIFFFLSLSLLVYFWYLSTIFIFSR